MTIRILCLHGVKTNEDGDWLTRWKKSIRDASAPLGVNTNAFEYHDLRYNDRFEQAHITPEVLAKAVKRLRDRHAAHRFSRLRPIGKKLLNLIENTFGMVAKWSALPTLRQQLASDLSQRIDSVNPHLICAHSLGSLIAYDTLTANPALAQDRVLVTLGSQIGHPALANIFGGQLKPLTTARHWYHLFNEEDDILTSPLSFPDAPFTQLDTYFNKFGPLDHSSVKYLGHSVTAHHVWARLA